MNDKELSPVGRPKPRVALVGYDGNAFAVLGKVKGALRKAGYTPEECSQYIKAATAGDYDNLLQVSMEWAEVD